MSLTLFSHRDIAVAAASETFGRFVYLESLLEVYGARLGSAGGKSVSS